MRSDFLYIKGISEDFLLCTMIKCSLIMMNGFQAFVYYQNLNLKCYPFFMWLITGFCERNYFEYVIVYTINLVMYTVLHRGSFRE